MSNHSVAGRAIAASALLLLGCGRAPAGSCTDRNEARAFACSGGSARRAGDTLFVRLSSGRDLSFIDDPHGEAPGGFHYAGRIGGATFHMIERYGHESAETFILVNAQTGRRVEASDEPVLSPDGMRFATAAEPDWNNCSERNHPSLDIWRLTDSVPVREWRLDPFDCQARTGWGPIHPHWRTVDTLEFLRSDEVRKATPDSSGIPVQYRTTPMRAVHDVNGWRIPGPG